MPSFFRRISLFNRLPRAKLARLTRIARRREFPAGRTVFSAGEPARHMFVVLSGRIKIESPAHGRKRKTYSYLRRGDFFGEMALLDNDRRSASAISVEDSSLLIVSKADFKNLLLTDPALSLALIETLSARLRRADEEIEGLLFGTLVNRLAKLLRSLARGTRRAPINARRRGPTQQELADMLGTSREPLARALAILRRAGAVNSSRRGISVISPAKLEAFCSIF
jgi:CRP-like cAMP-binding protein